MLRTYDCILSETTHRTKKYPNPVMRIGLLHLLSVLVLVLLLFVATRLFPSQLPQEDATPKMQHHQPLAANERNPPSSNSTKKKRVQLVVISIGDKNLAQYNRVFRRSHEKYAERHGYDFKVFREHLDQSDYKLNNISLPFQKHLVSDSSYDFVIFIDSDILINTRSPAIHDSEDFGDKLGIADEYSQPSSKSRLRIQKTKGWETSGTAYYKLCDLDLQTNIVLNSGVLVIQPKKHKEFLQRVYKTYLPLAIKSKRGAHCEQTALGYELQRSQKHFVLSNKWNAIWALQKLETFLFHRHSWSLKRIVQRITGSEIEEYFQNNYFMHFAGGTDLQKVASLEKKFNKYTQ